MIGRIGPRLSAEFGQPVKNSQLCGCCTLLDFIVVMFMRLVDLYPMPRYGNFSSVFLASAELEPIYVVGVRYCIASSCGSEGYFCLKRYSL